MPGPKEEAVSSNRPRRDLLKGLLGAGLAALASPLLFMGCGESSPPIPPHRPDYAVGRFLKSMNCSQAILETYAPALGMPALLARRVAAALAGGMGMGSECGAVTGAMLVIGLKYGKTGDTDASADKATFQRVAALCREFTARHGHLGCSQLLEVDMGSHEGVKEAAEAGFFTQKCPAYVRSAAEILDNIL